MAKYSIRDLENFSGIKAHTIRIWEKRYKIISPERTKTNIRYYTEKDLKKILNIAILNKSGMKVSDIAQLDDKQINEKIIYLSNTKNPSLQVEKLVLSMIGLDEKKFERDLSRIILQKNFKETVTEVIFPFLKKIGLLWQAGTINPAQEHFASNIIRGKLITAIDSQIFREDTSKTFILFLPENELHELSLLFYSYLLREKGYNVIYLGQSVPLSDLLEIAKQVTFNFLFCSILTNIGKEEFISYVNKLSSSLPDKLIFLTGKQLQNYNDTILPENTRVVTCMNDFEKQLSSLDY